MPCPRCQKLPLTAAMQGTLLLTSVVQELFDKLVLFLNRQGIAHQVQDLVATIDESDLIAFLEQVRQAKAFNLQEQQGISALLLEPGEALSFHAFNRARTLSKWYALLDARDLLEVLEQQRFISWFQPILAAKDGAVVGHEALLRGQRPDGALMSPAEIFAGAESADLLFQVDRQAREAALRCAAAQGVSGHLFVNFVPTAVYDPLHCLKNTVHWARHLGFRSDRIVFEVVETEKVGDIDHLKKILDFYRDAGYRIALDDVGSGYASLNLLALLKPDIIKVDMEIVRGIDHDSGRQSVFRALVGIARELNIQVLAEGIETLAEYDYVRAQGVDLLQGYLFARPAAKPQPPEIGMFG